MSAVTSYSRTAASNNAAPPNGWPEGAAASTVNDCAREMMKGIVDEATNNACKVVASVAGTNTITGSMTPDITAYSAGMIVVLTPANTNTGATTLNLDSLGALDVFNIDGSACVGGELVAGIPAVLVLDSGADDWVIVNPNVLKSRGREAGYRQSLQNQQNGSYTLVVGDAGKTIQYTGAGGHTYTLPSSVLFADDMIQIWNTSANTLTIAATAGLYWLGGAGLVGPASRTLAAGGAAVVQHNAGSNWVITGVGIS